MQKSFHLLHFTTALMTLFALYPPGMADEIKDRKRPAVGLVLAGGGALGFAHVGVLQVLEENRIPIDLVTGTSMGAIIGGAYAAGVETEEMQQLLLETDWNALFDEDVPRRDVPYRYKSGRNRELYGDVKFRFEDSALVLPQGLIQGQNVMLLVQRLYKTVPSPIDFDDLPLPFRAVTADIETGEAVIPESGDLATVVRASMSVPGFFAPVEIGNRLLVDGGIVNNLPVDEALKMGANRLIVVELYASLKNRKQLNSPLDITGQIISLLLAQNTVKQHELLKGRGVLIEPELQGLSATDFDKAEQLMRLGREAAERMLPELRQLTVPEQRYLEYQQKRTRPAADPGRVDFIRLNNNSSVPEKKLLRLLTIREGERFDQRRVEETVTRIYNTGWFSEVKYQRVQSGGEEGLIISTAGKNWYDDYFRLGFALDDDFEGDDSNYRLGVSYRRADIGFYGAYADFDFQIGSVPAISAELYQPLTPGSPYFIAPLIGFGRRTLDVRLDDEVIGEYQRSVGLVTLRTGREIGTLGELDVGATRGFGEFEREVGDPVLPEFSYDIGDVFSGFVIDALDTPDFPTTGFLAFLQERSALEELGSSETFHSLNGRLTLPWSAERNTLLLISDFGITFGERPIERSYSLGGFLDVSGFGDNQLTASDYAAGRFVFYRRFSELQIPLLNFGFFAGGSFEMTTLKSDIQQMPDEPLILGGSLFFGADTPLLPTYLAVGGNDQNEYAVYFILGRIEAETRWLQ